MRAHSLVFALGLALFSFQAFAGQLIDCNSSNTPAAYGASQAPTSCDSAGSLAINAEGRKPTYDTSVTITLTGAVANNDVCLLPGAAGKVVRVLSAEISLAATAATTTTALGLRKGSAAPTGTAGTAMTVVPRDSASAAAVAVPVSWTNSSAETPGTLVGFVTFAVAQFTVLASGAPAPTRVVFASNDGGQALVLRGVAQNISWNLNGLTTPGGGVANCRFTWTEE